MSKPAFRTQTPPRPTMSSTGDYAPRPNLVIDGVLREVGPFELADMRRREVLERDLNDAMRRRALHLRTGNMAAYRKANAQADRYLDLIAAGIASHRWEK
jgi:hypothetical protein